MFCQKLDPAVMHFSCLTAGTLLARLGRPEVTNCIAGLKQYNYAYEEAGEEAVEMERSYSSALNGESDIGHMASVLLAHQGASTNAGAGSGTGASVNASQQHGQQMAIDHSPTIGSYGQNGTSHRDPNAVSSFPLLLKIGLNVNVTCFGT